MYHRCNGRNCGMRFPQVGTWLPWLHRDRAWLSEIFLKILVSVSIHVLQPHETEVLKTLGLIQYEATHSVGDIFHFVPKGVLRAQAMALFCKISNHDLGVYVPRLGTPWPQHSSVFPCTLELMGRLPLESTWSSSLMEGTLWPHSYGCLFCTWAMNVLVF